MFPSTVGHQAPPSMGFSRQGYWSGLPCPSPGDLPIPGIKPKSLRSPALADRFFITRATWEAEWAFSACEQSCFSRVRLFATPWTVASQVLLSMGFSRQGYWSGLLCPFPGDLPEPVSLVSPDWQAGSLPRGPPGLPWLGSQRWK